MVVLKFSFSDLFLISLFQLFCVQPKTGNCLSPLWESIKTTVYEGYNVMLDNGSSMKAIRKIDKHQDSDIIIGEDVAQGNQIVLVCSSFFNSRWVYTGDGKPEYTTNNTVEYVGHHGMRANETNGAKRYRATLFLGYHRKLSPLDSGRYNCMTTSPDTGSKYYKLSAFYYVYVPGRQLFTRTTGDTIYFDVEKSPARIPCSVTNPRVAVSLQKYENGALKCQPHEEMFFHPVSGFYPQQNIEGTYVCTAAFNKTFEVLYFTLLPAELDLSKEDFGSQIRDHSASSEKLHNHNSHVEEPDFEEEPVTCTESSCGKDAECFIKENGSFEAHGGVKVVNQTDCRCPSGFFGNPFQQCHRSHLDWFA